MVWQGVSYDGTSESYFCEKGAKISAKVYQGNILEPIVKPLNVTLFKNQHWTFLQDSAAAHKAKTSQNWLEKNIPDFIKATDWSSSSSDLNHLDYECGQFWSEWLALKDTQILNL